MGLSGSGINEENHIFSGTWIAWLIDGSIGAILFVPFCPYHFVRAIKWTKLVDKIFVPYHFVLEPMKV